jgi:hypothetical protein
VTSHRASPVRVDLVLAAARAEWLTLSRLLEELPPVPCRVGDPEAWWPRTQREWESPATRMAVAACSLCRARAACLTYAKAAGEREGVWGGTLPEERRAAVRGW